MGRRGKHRGGGTAKGEGTKEAKVHGSPGLTGAGNGFIGQSWRSNIRHYKENKDLRSRMRWRRKKTQLCPAS